MCDEAPVRGNATMRDIVPTHGNATTLDSMLAENMIGAGVIPDPLPYRGRSMPLWLGFGPPSRVEAQANPQVGAQLIPIFRRDCAASSQSRKSPPCLREEMAAGVSLGKRRLSGTGGTRPIGISAFGHLGAEGPSSRSVVGKPPAA